MLLLAKRCQSVQKKRSIGFDEREKKEHRLVKHLRFLFNHKLIEWRGKENDFQWTRKIEELLGKIRK